MSHLSVSPQARRDLKEIVLYVARERPEAAHRLRQSLERIFRALAMNPSMGESRPDLGPEIRVLSFGNYAVFFRPTGTRVVIARVIHGARDLGQLWLPH